jgi:hypothetical protein
MMERPSHKVQIGSMNGYTLVSRLNPYPRLILVKKHVKMNALVSKVQDYSAIFDSSD